MAYRFLCLPLAFVTLAASLTAGCSKKSSSPARAAAADAPPAQTGALAVGTQIIAELGQGLTTAALTTPSQNAAIAASATNQMQVAVGSIVVQTATGLDDLSAVETVAAPVIKGAVASLGTTQVNLADLAVRASVVKVIVGSVVGSLGGRISTQKSYDLIKSLVTTAIQKLADAGLATTGAPRGAQAVTGGTVEALAKAGVLPADLVTMATKVVAAAVVSVATLKVPDDVLASTIGGAAAGAIGNLGKAGITSSQVSGAAASVANIAVTNLKTFNLISSHLLTAVQQVASGSVGALADAGVAADLIGEAAKQVASSSVTALSAAGAKQENVGALAGAVAAGAIQGLGTAGLSAAQIVSSGSVSGIVNGTAGALSGSSLSAADAGDAIGSIATAALRAISTSNLSGGDATLRSSVLKQVIDGSATGMKAAGLDGGNAVSALSVVTQNLVGALSASGFTGSEIGQATASVVASSLTSAVNAGLATAATASTLAASLGAAVGAACVNANIAIDVVALMTQTDAAAKAVGITDTSAVLLQTITGTASGAALASTSSSTSTVLATLQTAVTSGTAFSGLSASQASSITGNAQAAVATATTLASTVKSGGLTACTTNFPASLAANQYPATIAGISQPVYCQASTGVCPLSISSATYSVTWSKVGTTGACTVAVVSTIANVAPTLSITEPAGGNDVIPRNGSFQITFAAADPDDAAHVSLYYKRSNSACDATLAGWTLLTSALVEGTDSAFNWATTGVTPGNYYICGAIDDGHNPVQYAVSGSYLKIDAPPVLSLTAPAAGGATVVQGANFNIQMSAADTDDDPAFALYYSATNTGCAAGLTGWTQIAAALPASTTSLNWSTTGVSAGTYFICGVINDGVNAEVYALSAGSVTVQSALPPLTGQWHFNETSGTTVADTSGNGNNGTFGAGVTLNDGGCHCVTFDQTSSISIANPTALPLGNSPYAITVWIKPDTMTNRLGITGWGSYGSSGRTSAFRTADSTGLTNYWFGPDIEYTGAAVATLQDGNWHFVAAQYDGTKRSLWYDGAKVDEDTPGPANFDSSIFKIGETYPSLEYFKGSMDELTIYRGALTAQQMAAFYAAGRN